MNPSATVFDFQLPWRFTVKRSAPESASIEMEERLKQCPVYSLGFDKFKNVVIWFGIGTSKRINTYRLYCTKIHPVSHKNIHGWHAEDIIPNISTISSPRMPPTVPKNSLEILVLVFGISSAVKKHWRICTFSTDC